MKKIIGILLLTAMLFTSAFALASCVNSGEKVKVIDIQLSEEEYAFAVRKGDSEMLGKINDFLAEIKENGKFDDIMNKYFGDGTPTGVTSATKDSSKRDKQLWVATNAAFEPFEYVEGNKYYGVDMEIMSLFAAHLDLELVIDDMDFDSVVLNLGTDKCDIGAAGLTVKEDRKVHVDFTDSYYNASQVLIVPAKDKTFDECKTKEDVEKILTALTKDDKIGVQNGTTGMAYIIGDDEFEFPGLTAGYSGFENGALAVQDMINGNVKFVMIDEAPAKAIATKVNKVS